MRSLLVLLAAMLLAPAAVAQNCFPKGSCTSRRAQLSSSYLIADGVACATPTSAAVGSGPSFWYSTCTDSDAATLYGSFILPLDYVPGIFSVGIRAVSVNAAPAGNLVGHVALQCRGDGDVHNSTWGSEVELALNSFDTQNEEKQATTTALLTPNGTCVAGDVITFRYQVDATGTTATNLTDLYISDIWVIF